MAQCGAMVDPAEVAARNAALAALAPHLSGREAAGSMRAFGRLAQYAAGPHQRFL